MNAPADAFLPLALDDGGLGTRLALPEDFEPLWEVHREALGPWVEATWGWDEEDQRRRFTEDWAFEREVVLRDAVPCGAIRVEDRGDALFIDYVALACTFRRRGIGTCLVRAVLERAARRDVPVGLNVLRANPARTLYERLGFRVAGGDDHRFFMWTARREAR